ncbi:hypothetical protein T01_1182 [Trichinella spiralis]|uniref:Uncharacterized protein n=1 Tax=Trichinella spiralis TaxID=6334 RepID=A0A0V1BJ80_TRISP|nr:hypothetical protein T01_1182 [Trichinella spiralis]
MPKEEYFLHENYKLRKPNLALLFSTSKGLSICEISYVDKEQKFEFGKPIVTDRYQEKIEKIKFTQTVATRVKAVDVLL